MNNIYLLILLVLSLVSIIATTIKLFQVLASSSPTSQQAPSQQAPSQQQNQSPAQQAPSQLDPFVTTNVFTDIGNLTYTPKENIKFNNTVTLIETLYDIDQATIKCFSNSLCVGYQANKITSPTDTSSYSLYKSRTYNNTITTSDPNYIIYFKPDFIAKGTGWT
jgi:hypothetical protein